METEENNKLKAAGFSDVNVDELSDITKLRIDGSKTPTERREQYLKQIGNPYMVRVGDTVVRLSFADSGTSFEEAFENLLSMS